MPKRVATAAEEYIKKQKTVHLKHLIEQYGIKVKLFASQSGTYSKVYGTDAGANQKLQPVAEIDVIVTPDDFFPVSTTQAGSFVEGWMYSNDERIQVGQVVEIVSPIDKKIRQYRIEGIWGRGMTLDVFKRYKIVAMGGW